MGVKCFHCKGPEELDMVLVSCDGDFVHRRCLKSYEKEKDYFLNVIIHDDKKMKDWLANGS